MEENQISTTCSDECLIINPEQTAVPVRLDIDALKIMTPARIIISGPTDCGKSSLISQFIKFRHDIFDCDFSRIIYCYPPNTAHFKYDYLTTLQTCFDKIELIEGIPNINDFHPDKPSLLVIDDLYLQAINSNFVYQLFIHNSHHLSVTVLLACHNIFEKGRHSVTLNRNITYRVVFFDAANNYILRLLGSQMFPDSANSLLHAMSKLNEVQPQARLKYLFLDLCPHSKRPLNLRIETNIFSKHPLFFFP